jgi:hypothetical protein
MDWINRINDIKFSIETGDGKIFYPLYKGGEKEKEFNTSSFEFINVYGTLVDRKKPKSGVFPLVFWFQGADNIDQADEFDISSDDPRPWTVTHPFYGTIKGHPINIKRDDSNLNITEVTVPFWESIDADYPLYNYSIKDNTRDRHNTVLVACGVSYTTNNPVVSADIPKLQTSITDMGGAMMPIQDGNTFSDFQNFLNSGLKAIDKLTEGPLNAIQQIQNFVDLPATYEQALLGRIGSYQNIYYRLKDSIDTLSDKKYFEAMGATVIASTILAMTLPIPGDYVLVSDVFGMSVKLSVIYEDYLKTLDDQRVSIYDTNNAFSPDATVQTELNSLYNFAQANLYQISFLTKTERIVVVDKDTNIILLVHRYLGMDDNGDNLEIFKKTNNIFLNELFEIKKGREIRYAK